MLSNFITNNLIYLLGERGTLPGSPRLEMVQQRQEEVSV